MSTKISHKRNELSSAQGQALMTTLKNRFEAFPSRHKGISWREVEKRLTKNTGKLWSLAQMEKTGGEPDVVCLDPKSREIVFVDCATESPSGRRSLCYDRAALESRKEHKPKNSALDMAASMGIEILTEIEYRELQTLESFDLKTSSWIATPAAMRKLGGALFCDRRYDHVFVYHNGAESYYAARGWRGKLVV